MKSIYLLTSLTNLKTALNYATNTTYDHFLNQLIARATARCESYTGRKLRGRTYGSNGIAEEYYDGTGSSRLYTNHKPIISVSSLYDDLDRNFNSDTLFSSTDYAIFKAEGIIQLMPQSTKGSSFMRGIANVKLIYTAGYDEFQIIEDTNDRIDFNEGGSSLVGNLTAGIYTASSLASHIATILTAAATATVTCTYNYHTSKFTITSDGATFELEWNTGDNSYRSAVWTLGYREAADDTAAVTYTSDDSVLGIPADLEQACTEICLRWFNESTYGKNTFDKKTERIEGQMAGTTSFDPKVLPKNAMDILETYKRRMAFEH